MNNLIVSAVEFEITPILNALKLKDQHYESFHCGIGPLNAAKSISELKTKAQNKNVIFVGTCGVFSGFEKTEIVTASNVSWQPACLRHDLGSEIEGLYPDIQLRKLDPEFNSVSLGKIREVSMICSSVISLNSSLNNPAVSGRTCENLEFYSVAEELKNVSKTFVNFFAITNEICPEARSQWKRNFKEAASLTANVVLNYLDHINH